MDEENEVFMFSFYLHIVDYKYDEDNETLTVSYDNGAVVQYTEVPKHMAHLLQIAVRFFYSMERSSSLLIPK